MVSCRIIPDIKFTLRTICRAERDLVLFHNRGLMHTIVGAFKEDQVRLFHQCNIAGSDDPKGPSEDDVLKWTMKA